MMYLFDILNDIFIVVAIPVYIRFAWKFYFEDKKLNDKGKTRAIIICMVSMVMVALNFLYVINNDQEHKILYECHHSLDRLQRALLLYEKNHLSKNIDDSEKKQKLDLLKEKREKNTKLNNEVDILKNSQNFNKLDEMLDTNKEEGIEVKNRVLSFKPENIDEYNKLIKELKKLELIYNWSIEKQKNCLYGVEYINDVVDVYCSNHGSLNKQSKCYFSKEEKERTDNYRLIKSLIIFFFTVCSVTFVINGCKFDRSKYKSFILYKDSK